MIKKISVLFLSLFMAGGFALAGVQPALAADCAGGGSIRDGINCAPDSQKTQTVQGGVRTAVNTLLWVVGVASVIVLIVGGLRYILSGGNSTSINAAKDTILYAVIGIVVALLAYAIVNFTLGQFGA